MLIEVAGTVLYAVLGNRNSETKCLSSGRVQSYNKDSLHQSIVDLSGTSFRVYDCLTTMLYT